MKQRIIDSDGDQIDREKVDGKQVLPATYASHISHQGHTRSFSPGGICGWICVAFLLVTVGAFGQSTTGEVYGTVSDTSGALIPDANVTIINVETHLSQTTKSNSQGEYLFPTLNPGKYAVKAVVPGFKVVTQLDLSLSANQNVHASFTLEPGGAAETVTVQAATTLVDTREAQLAQTIDQSLIEDLPLNGRSPYGLASIIPGVTNYSPDTAIGARNGTRFSINGLPASTTNFYLDGAQDIAISTQVSGGNILPNPDALQEVRLLTSNFDAEFGRSPGGVLSAITRSGTSQYHGLAFDYIRNDAFNTSNYFLNGVTPLKQNQFGGDFGGPLWHGGKAFFFLSYEGLIIHTPAVVSANVVTATALERTGDFSQSKLKPTKLPKTKNCGTVAAPVICKYALDPVAQNLLAFVPVFNGATGLGVQQSAPANSNVNQELARIDYQITPAHQLEAMFFTSRGSESQPNAVGNQILAYSGMNSYQNTDNVVLVDTWVISPRSVNSIRLFYTQNRSIVSPMFPGHTWASLGSTVAAGGPSFAPPDFAINGYFNEGTNQGGPNDNTQLAFGPIETLTLTRGRHSIKAGGAFVWNKYAFDGGFQDNGILTFSGNSSGNALADFLLGEATNFFQNTPQVLHTHLPNPSLFAQDNWQVAARLNINMGIRWEVNPSAVTGYEGTFKPGVQSQIFPTAPIGLVYPGDPGVPPGIYNTPYTNFAPRVGFAYDLSGNGRTGLRGGVGKFYSSDDELSSVVDQPFTLSVTTNNTPNLVTPFAPNPDPFPYVVDPKNPHFTSGSGVNGAPLDGGKTPYVYEYNLTLEQQLGNSWATRIGYVGNSGHGFYVNHDINQPEYAPGASTTTAGLNARRPYQPTPSTYVFSVINVHDPLDNTHYNSLQATLRGTFGRRSSVLASYVWSKTLDYGYGDGFVDGTDVRKQFGVADIDQRHTFAAGYLYQLPNTRAFGIVGKEILSGWQINGITTLHSGSPFTVISGVDSNLNGVVNDRPDVVGTPQLPTSRSRQQKIQQFFNPTAFVRPTGPYGNEQRNYLAGPGFINTDLSVFKQFALTDRAALQFRTEAFNTFKNVNLGIPVASLTSPKVGEILTAGSPRILQFALKILF